MIFGQKQINDMAKIKKSQKIFYSKKVQELRKHFIRTNGKKMYKAQLDPLFEKSLTTDHTDNRL